MITDELGSGNCDNAERPQWSYAHIFDIGNETDPKLVSRIKTQAQDPANCQAAGEANGGVGGFGLGTYALLLVIPIVGGLASPRDSQYRARLYGCVLLVVSYFVLGLPDTMLSFPLHNALYVVLTAMLCNYCRDERGARPAVPRSEALQPSP